MVEFLLSFAAFDLDALLSGRRNCHTGTTLSSALPAY